MLLAGSLLLGRGLPLDLTVHLRMCEAALARAPTARTSAGPCRAYTRYAREHDPEDSADLLVLADHPDRPAVRRVETGRWDCGRGGS